MLELTAITAAVPGFDLGPIDCQVDDEVLTVLGPSGSGKTTLLSLVAGIVEPDAGSITLDGRELVGQPIEARGTGLVFQDGALFPHLTARANVAYAATDPDVVDDLAAVLEIDDVLDRRPDALSGGERQRVALARTLAADPDALLLDEPLSSLDAPIRRRLRDELHDLFADLAIPVVYVTHDQRTAVSLGDRLAILHGGAIEQIGDPSAVVDRPATAFVARFTGTENVFDATVVDAPVAYTAIGNGEADTVAQGGRRLRIGEVACRAEVSAPGGSAVTACIHPSRVQLRARDAPPTGGQSGGPPSDLDAVGIDRPGIVERAMHEGDRHRIVVSVEGLPRPLTAAVSLPVADGVPITRGAPVQVTVPSDGIHVID